MLTFTLFDCLCLPAGVLFYFFKPSGAGSCSLNVFLITASLLLCIGFSALSLLPMARNGSLFPSSTTALYIMYLCYSALQSEPRDYECNGLGHRLNAASGSTLVIGMLVTLLSVVYSALRAGGFSCLFVSSLCLVLHYVWFCIMISSLTLMAVLQFHYACCETRLLWH
jgi:hypothetical protein